MAVKPIDRVCNDIRTGKSTAVDVMKIFDAVKVAANLGHISSEWRINCLGVTVSSDDITVDEADRVEQLTDLDWQNIEPASSASHFKAIVLTILQTRGGLELDQAEEKFKTLTVVEAAQSISVVWNTNDEEDGAPLDTGVSVTT